MTSKLRLRKAEPFKRKRDGVSSMLAQKKNGAYAIQPKSLHRSIILFGEQRDAQTSHRINPLNDGKRRDPYDT